MRSILFQLIHHLRICHQLWSLIVTFDVCNTKEVNLSNTYRLTYIVPWPGVTSAKSSLKQRMRRHSDIYYGSNRIPKLVDNYVFDSHYFCPKSKDKSMTLFGRTTTLTWGTTCILTVLYFPLYISPIKQHFLGWSRSYYRFYRGNLGKNEKKKFYIIP